MLDVGERERARQAGLPLALARIDRQVRLEMIDAELPPAVLRTCSSPVPTLMQPGRGLREEVGGMLLLKIACGAAVAAAIVMATMLVGLVVAPVSAVTLNALDTRAAVDPAPTSLTPDVPPVIPGPASALFLVGSAR